MLGQILPSRHISFSKHLFSNNTLYKFIAVCVKRGSSELLQWSNTLLKSVARTGLKILGIKIFSYDYVLNRLISCYDGLKITNKNNKSNGIKRRYIS